MIEAIEPQKRFGPIRVVNNLSFTTLNGSITGLLGANGAGKTTTLRILSGALRQESGRVRVDGRFPEEGPPVRTQIGALLDHTGLYSRLTVREHLVYFGELYGLSRMQIGERVQELLSVLGLESIADRR